MFAAAVAPYDVYDEKQAKAAVALLGNDPDGELACAYCGALAETWDHVFATVKQSRFSGHGHRLGNLLPCCKPCNSSKGNKPWEVYLGSLPISDAERADRFETISRYLAAYSHIEVCADPTADHERLEAIRAEILLLVAEGDNVAERIRHTNGVR